MLPIMVRLLASIRKPKHVVSTLLAYDWLGHYSGEGENNASNVIYIYDSYTWLQL